MPIIDAQRIDTPRPHWILEGPNEERRILEAGPTCAYRLALIGTRTDRIRHGKLRQFAQTLSALGGPVMLIDVRRSGVGANNTWGPLEFRSRLPLMLEHLDYSYLHVPELAPTEDLLESARARCGAETDWQEFAAAYRASLTDSHLRIARALAEWSGHRKGWLLLMCAEQHLDDFNDLPASWQNRHYCHRYTLANLIATTLHAHHPDTPIMRRCLTLGDAQTTDYWNGPTQSWVPATACSTAPINLSEPSRSFRS